MARQANAAPPPLPSAGAPLVVDPATVNAGDHLRASTLFTTHFVRDFMGQDGYQDVPLVLGGQTMEDFKVDRILAFEDGSFMTEGRYLAYGHQLVHARTTWWREDGFWKVNGQELLPSDSGAIPSLLGVH